MAMSIKSRIRTIPDHPKPGVMFRDITTLLLDPQGLRERGGRTARRRSPGVRVDKVAGIEARGFILGGAVAHQLGAGFVPVRKRGKLPCNTLGQDYELEYGTDRVEIHTDAIAAGRADPAGRRPDRHRRHRERGARADRADRRRGGRLRLHRGPARARRQPTAARARRRGPHALCEFEGE